MIEAIAEVGKSNFFSFLLRNGEPYYVATTSKALATKLAVGSLLEIHGRPFFVKRVLTEREYTQRYQSVRYRFGRKEVGWYEVSTD